MNTVGGPGVADGIGIIVGVVHCHKRSIVQARDDRVLRKNRLDGQGIGLRVSLPRASQIRSRSQPELPGGDGEFLRMCSTVHTKPHVSDRVSKERIRALQTFPGFGERSRLKDDADVLVRPADAGRSFSLRNRAPDSSFISEEPARFSLRLRAVTNVKEFPYSVLFIPDRHRSPKRGARVLTGLVSAGNKKSGN